MGLRPLYIFTLLMRGSTLDVRFERLKSIPALKILTERLILETARADPGWKKGRVTER